MASASNTISVARTDLAVSAPLNLSGNLITLDTTGDWTGTFDGEDGTYYLNAVNLTNFNLPFAANLSGTTTDALAQGTNNLYWSNTRFDSRFATRFAATTSDALPEGTTNQYFTNTKFDSRFATRFAATTTDALAEGIANLYYTTARFAANLSGTTTDALTQGITNRYFTDILFDSRFGTRFSATTTDALAQGVNNLYWSNTLFDSRFGTRFAATTSDALAQGVNNLYWSNPLFDSRFAARFDATTTDALSEGNNNLYWLDSRFDTAFLATTSVSTLLALPSLGTVGTITQGVWNGTAIDVTRGGTGLTSGPAYGNLPVGNNTGGYTLTATSGLGHQPSRYIGYAPGRQRGNRSRFVCLDRHPLRIIRQLVRFKHAFAKHRRHRTDALRGRRHYLCKFQLPAWQEKYRIPRLHPLRTGRLSGLGIDHDFGY